MSSDLEGSNTMHKKTGRRLVGLLAAAWAALFFVGASFRVLADCASFGLPFTDLGSTSFCAAIAEAYYTGITHGTSATTFSPTAPVNREQAAIFATRTLDSALARGSRRAALGQWWTTTPHYDLGLGATPLADYPGGVASDGADLWVTGPETGIVSRVRASDGRVLETWTDAPGAGAVLVAVGRVFVVGGGSLNTPGALYGIDPSQPAGPVSLLTNNLGGLPSGIAFDGSRIWTANQSGSVSIVEPGTWNVTNVSTGFSIPNGLVFDGANMWVTDSVSVNTGFLRRLDPAAAILQSVSVGGEPLHPVFDGQNIWVPAQNADSVAIVRASDGLVLRKIPGIFAPVQAAFDGRRVLVSSGFATLALFDAATLTLVDTLQTPGVRLPHGVCSDGVNFWVTFTLPASVARF